MGEVSGDQLLWFLEQGHAADKREQLAILATVGGLGDRLDAVPLGGIDRCILKTHLDLITPQEDVIVVCKCGHCGEELEFQQSLLEILENSGQTEPASTSFEYDGQPYDLRLPCLHDISAEGVILQNLNPSAPWSDEGFLRAAGEALSDADPMLNLSIALRCANCEEVFSDRFDPAQFLWNELTERAKALLDDVVVMAKALGWSESDIVTMSPERRNLYIDRLSA